MAQSDTEIANLALGHLGVGKEIANLTTESSAEATACRRYFEQARRQTLRDFPWPFASKIAALSLIEEDPNDEWDYSYRYPSDCLRILKILSDVRTDTPDSRIPYKESFDSTGKLIFTDRETPDIEYTADVTNVAVYPDDFVMAMSLRLAAYIAPSISGGDPFGMRKGALELYVYELSRAQANIQNEQQPDPEPDSIFIRTRT